MITSPLLPPGLEISLSKLSNAEVGCEAQFEDEVSATKGVSDNKYAKKKNQANKKKKKAKKAKKRIDGMLLDGGHQAMLAESADVLEDQRTKHLSSMYQLFLQEEVGPETNDSTNPIDDEKPWTTMMFGSVETALYHRSITLTNAFNNTSGSELDSMVGRHSSELSIHLPNTSSLQYALEVDGDDDDDNNDDKDDEKDRQLGQAHLSSEVAGVPSNDFHEDPTTPTLDVRSTIDAIKDELQLTNVDSNQVRPRSRTSPSIATIAINNRFTTDSALVPHRRRCSFDDHFYSRDYDRGWNCFRSTHTMPQAMLTDDVPVVPILHDQDDATPMLDGQSDNKEACTKESDKGESTKTIQDAKDQFEEVLEDDMGRSASSSGQELAEETSNKSAGVMQDNIRQGKPIEPLRKDTVDEAHDVNSSHSIDLSDAESNVRISERRQESGCEEHDISEKNGIEVILRIHEEEINLAEEEGHHESHTLCIITDGNDIEIDRVHVPHDNQKQELIRLWRRGERYFQQETSKKGIVFCEILNKECHFRIFSESERERYSEQVMSNHGECSHRMVDTFPAYDLSPEEEEVMKEVYRISTEKAAIGVPTLIRDRRIFCHNHGSKNYPFAQIVDTQGNLNPISIEEAKRRRLIQGSSIASNAEITKGNHSTPASDNEDGLREGATVILEAVEDHCSYFCHHHHPVSSTPQGDQDSGNRDEERSDPISKPPRRIKMKGSNAARLAALKRSGASSSKQVPSKITTRLYECKTLYSKATTICEDSNSVASSTDSGLFLNDV